ncbi:MAG: helix-hairpin-helix domain-containing protein [Rikenellaceae bacterium]
MTILKPREIIGITLCAMLVASFVIYRNITPQPPVEQTLIELSSRDSVVVELTPFDPNTVSYQHLMSFGMTRLEALSIIRFREAGKVYRFREDILSCDAVSDSLYYILEPYITIGKEFEYKPKFQTQTSTPKQNVTNYKTTSYTPQPEAKKIELIDINLADSASLRSVYGIGEKSVTAIMEYRQRLGGFHSAEQLKELKVITESNYEKIIEQICCNNYDISKIDINFASAKELSTHPYITSMALRRLLKYRELKGGWSTVEDMIEDNILTLEEAIKLRPYLEFTLQNNQ